MTASALKSERQLRKELVAAVRRLETEGLNQGSSGNLSCRSGDRFLITPTGARGASLDEDRIVAINRDGGIISEGIPSSEWRMHLGILLAFPDVSAVVHTHGDCCVALSCLRRPIPAFHYMLARFGGDDVPCARYATFGSKELADNVIEALSERSACLLANHGMIVHAHSIEDAVDGAIKLETLSRQYILAVQAGTPALLSSSEMARVRDRYRYYGVAPMPE